MTYRYIHKTNKGHCIKYACPHCQVALKNPLGDAGNIDTCPACKNLITVPGEAEAQEFRKQARRKEGGEPPRAPEPPERKQGPPTRPTKFCHACAAKIDQQAEICPKCGVRQAWVTQSRSEDQPHKVTAALLALLLGLLGAHHFYLGKTEMGIFYLLMNIFLFWTAIVPLIFMIVTIIEGLTYLSCSDAEFARKYAKPSTA